MPVIARDAVASDQLVYAWPFPINGSADVSCGEDEVVVMCPAWTVGDRLGPGRHAWRTPSPGQPSNAYFVLTAPVEAPFEMSISFAMPNNGAQVRLRAAGSMLVRCADAGLLVAQFVGLPFDRLNDGILHSVSQSVSRLLGRVLARRVVMAGTPLAVSDPSMLQSIAEELVAYNPTGGAVFGIEFVRFNQLAIQVDDAGAWDTSQSSNGWMMAQANQVKSQPVMMSSSQGLVASGEIRSAEVISPATAGAAASGEIAPRSTTIPPPPAMDEPPSLPAGSRVLVAGPDGRLHAAVVRQHMSGYYELEIGANGETVWVPMAQVLPES